MSVEVKVPVLPESVSEATLLTWHKNVGDIVHRDENLVDIETEKVVLEVPAPQDGTIKELVRSSGDTVLSDELIAVIEPQTLKEDESGPAASEPQKAKADTSTPSVSEQPETEQAKSAPMSPAVRKLVTANNLDISRISGTGKDGRVTKADVIKFLDRSPQHTDAEAVPMPSVVPTPPAVAMPPAAAAAVAKPPPAAATPAAATAAPVAAPVQGGRGERREPMTRLRATIAQRLVQAQHTAAMLTTFNDVNLQGVMDLRKRYRETFEDKHGVRLGFMSFFVKASLEALRRYPKVNASIEGNDIVYHDYYDIGIAAASPRGLVVPIVREADTKTFAQLEQEIADLAQKARDGTLTMDELSGGTFTITNGGVFGSMLSTPILNPPQSGILGMHRIDQRPVVENNEVVIRPMMYLALTYDHRIIDGAEAVRFLVTVKESLEDPTRLLLQI